MPTPIEPSSREEVKRIVIECCESFSQATTEKVFTGKNSPFEVTNEAWKACSFSFEELAERVADKMQLVFAKERQAGKELAKRAADYVASHECDDSHGCETERAYEEVLKKIEDNTL